MLSGRHGKNASFLLKVLGQVTCFDLGLGRSQSLWNKCKKTVLEMALGFFLFSLCWAEF